MSTKAEQHVDWFASDLFAGLDEADLALIGEASRPRKMDPGAEIFSLGDSAQRFYVIESGTVALTLPFRLGDVTRELTIEELGGGRVCAWSALVPPHKYTRSAHAVTETRLVEIDSTALEQTFEQHPRVHAAIAGRLSEVIASRLSRMEVLLLHKLEKSMVQQLGD